LRHGPLTSSSLPQRRGERIATAPGLEAEKIQLPASRGHQFSHVLDRRNVRSWREETQRYPSSSRILDPEPTLNGSAGCKIAFIPADTSCQSARETVMSLFKICAGGRARLGMLDNMGGRQLRRPPIIAQWSPRLLRHTLNSVPTEFCVLVTDFLGSFILGGIIDRLRFFETLPLVYGNALRRGAFKCRHF